MSAIGPQLPATPEQRRVEADRLLEAGHMPPWPLKEKPTTIKGHQLAAHTAQIMSRLAAANSTLANIEIEREKAEATVKETEAELERLGITSMYQFTSLGRRDYRICLHPTCERVDIHGWDSSAEWHCDEHKPPKPAPEAMPPATEKASEVLF